LKWPNEIDAALPGNKIQLTRDVFTSLEKKHSLPWRVFCASSWGWRRVVSALVVMLAMYTTITERTRENRHPQGAWGASRRYIVFIIESESAVD